MTKKVRAELERPLGDGLARGGPRGGAICSVLGCLPFMSPFSIPPSPSRPSGQGLKISQSSPGRVLQARLKANQRRKIVAQFMSS